MLSPAAAAVDGRRAPPSPHASEALTAGAPRVITPATTRRARSANSPSPHDALPLTQLSDSSPARQRDSPKLPQQPNKPLIDPASGYVPEIDAPPSVAVCSGHRCVRGSA